MTYKSSIKLYLCGRIPSPYLQDAKIQKVTVMSIFRHLHISFESTMSRVVANVHLPRVIITVPFPAKSLYEHRQKLLVMLPLVSHRFCKWKFLGSPHGKFVSREEITQNIKPIRFFLEYYYTCVLLYIFLRNILIWNLQYILAYSTCTSAFIYIWTRKIALMLIALVFDHHWSRKNIFLQWYRWYRNAIVMYNCRTIFSKRLPNIE